MTLIRKQGSVTVVAPRVAMLESSLDDVDRSVAPLLRDRPSFLVIDLNEVPLIDSKGLEYLLDVQDQAVRFGGEVKLSNANALCRDILSVTGVDRYVSLFGDTITALGSFSR